MAETTYPYQRLGRRIAELRAELRWSQRELARHAGITEGYIPRIETGRNRPDPTLLRSLARVLSADYAELAGLAGYADTPASDVVPVRPGYADVVRRLVERYTPAQLTRFERAMAQFFLETREVGADPADHARGEQGAHEPHEPHADDADARGA